MSSDNAFIYTQIDNHELINEIRQNTAIFDDLYVTFIEEINRELREDNDKSQYLNDVQLAGIRFMSRLASGCHILEGRLMEDGVTPTFFPSNMALNGDQIGTGKTIQLFVTCLFLKRFFYFKTKSLEEAKQQLDIRIMIVAPKFLVLKWVSEYEKFFGLRADMRLIENEENFREAMATANTYANVFVLSSSLLERPGFDEIFIELSLVYQISWIFGFDEVHYYRSNGTTDVTNAIAAIRLSETIWATIGCSGTCVMNHPLEIFNILNVLSGIPKNILGPSRAAKNICLGLEDHTKKYK